MRVRVDHGADAVYLNLTDRPIKDSDEVVAVDNGETAEDLRKLL